MQSPVGKGFKRLCVSMPELTEQARIPLADLTLSICI